MRSLHLAGVLISIAVFATACSDPVGYVGLEEAETPAIIDVVWPSDGHIEGKTLIPFAVGDRFTDRLHISVRIDGEEVWSHATRNDSLPVSMVAEAPTGDKSGAASVELSVRDDAGNEAAEERTLEVRNREQFLFGDDRVPDCFEVIHDAAVGTDGAVWMATSAGMMKVEGKQTTHYPTATPLGTCSTSLSFVDVDVDAEGRVWALGSNDASELDIYRLHNGTFERAHDLEGVWEGDTIDFFARPDTFWVVDRYTVLRIAEEGTEYAYESENFDTTILDADMADDGTLWIAEKSVVRRSDGNGNFPVVAVPVVVGDVYYEYFTYSEGYRAVHAESFSEAWVGYDGTVIHVADDGAKAVPLPIVGEPDPLKDYGVREMAVAADGALWALVGASGVWRLRGETLSFYGNYKLLSRQDLGRSAGREATHVITGTEGSVYVTIDPSSFGGPGGKLVYLGP